MAKRRSFKRSLEVSLQHTSDGRTNYYGLLEILRYAGIIKHKDNQEATVIEFECPQIGNMKGYLENQVGHIKSFGHQVKVNKKQRE